MMSLARLGMFNIGCWLLAAYHLFRKNVVCPRLFPEERSRKRALTLPVDNIL